MFHALAAGRPPAGGKRAGFYRKNGGAQALEAAGFSFGSRSEAGF